MLTNSINRKKLLVVFIGSSANYELATHTDRANHCCIGSFMFIRHGPPRNPSRLFDNAQTAYSLKLILRPICKGIAPSIARKLGALPKISVTA